MKADQHRCADDAAPKKPSLRRDVLAKARKIETENPRTPARGWRQLPKRADSSSVRRYAVRSRRARGALRDVDVEARNSVQRSLRGRSPAHRSEVNQDIHECGDVIAHRVDGVR